jgi:hypothetical protein
VLGLAAAREIPDGFDNFTGWSGLNIRGPMGIRLFLVGLSWWYVRAIETKDNLAIGKWRNFTQDVSWVLEQLF